MARVMMRVRRCSELEATRTHRCKDAARRARINDHTLVEKAVLSSELVLGTKGRQQAKEQNITNGVADNGKFKPVEVTR